MRKFRRFIIALVQVLQILSIIMATLGGGWLGWQIQQAMNYGSYGFAIAGQPAAGIVVPLLGGIIGFFYLQWAQRWSFCWSRLPLIREQLPSC
ncbi:MAG TPA: hypothetical protein VL048_21120 [Xanthobacteraceae bacterium]|nr:hypothetical protein [Xanthobacteraceae bacterium]